MLKENFTFFRETFTVYKVGQVDEIKKQNKGSEKPFRHWLWTHKRDCNLPASVLDPGHLPRLQELARELYQSFFHHYQGSIDFNTVNIHRTVGMYFLVSTGNRGDIE